MMVKLQIQSIEGAGEKRQLENKREIHEEAMEHHTALQRLLMKYKQHIYPSNGILLVFCKRWKSLLFVHQAMSWKEIQPGFS